jgi:ribosomal protein S18 acetylase RimI-like enzyme
MFTVGRIGPDGSAEVLRAAHLFDEPLDPDAVRDYLQDPRNVFFLAYGDAGAVGFLRGTELRQLGSTRRQMFLYEIAVDDRHRRNGIGSMLVRALLDHCRELDFDEVFVFTDDPGNVAAEGLYRSTGAVTETVGERMYVYRFAAGPKEAPSR